MNKLIWPVIVSCQFWPLQCWAQADAPIPAQFGGGGFIHACIFRNLQVACTMDPYTTVPPEEPHEESIGPPTISVRQLRHKIPKEAAKEFRHSIKLSRAGEHEKAAAELEEAMRRDPEFSSAEDRLGLEYVYLGRSEDAEMAFRRTIDMEPDWWSGHYNLALILYTNGNLSGAEQSMRRALTFSGENAKIHLALGAMLVKREETRAEGITELRFAARTMPDAKRALQNLGTQ